MSAFTPDEIEYLQSQTLGRLATVGIDDQPHVIPVTSRFNEDEDSIDVGGIDFASGKKWRDAQHNPRVTLLVDDVSEPRRARALEVRGTAEIHTTGGDTMNPRFPNFVPEFFRIRPTRIVSWGLEQRGVGASDYRPNARSV